MRRFIPGALAFLLIAGVAGATTLVKLEFSDLARDAHSVVVGTVTGLEGRYEETGRFIHTDVTLEVERYLRGSGPAELVVRTPGGQVGSEAQVAPGAPSFAIGEQVLVFLTDWDDGALKVLGYAQGKSTLFEGFDGRPVLRGGVVDGRSLNGVINELRNGSDHAIPLQPVK